MDRNGKGQMDVLQNSLFVAVALKKTNKKKTIHIALNSLKEFKLSFHQSKC